jgi:hypothetical protein
VPELHKFGCDLSAKPRAYIQYLMQMNLKQDELACELERYVKFQEKRVQEVMDKLKSQLTNEKKQLSKTKSLKNTLVVAKTELEDLFMRCVEEGKKDVMKR